MTKPALKSDYIKYIPYCIVGIFACVASCLTEWFSDASTYQFIFPPNDGDPLPSDHIRNLQDIFISQWNHYNYVNGRFFVHFLVQLFCGLLGKYIFAICNGLVWTFLPYLCLRFANCDVNSRNSMVSCSLVVLLIFYLRFDPPFQINYVWMSLMTIGYLVMFFNRKRNDVLTLIFLSFYSFFFGEGNESFSFIMAVAMLSYSILKRFNLSLRQWIMGLSFAIGAIILVVSPGNWLRLGLNGGENTGLGRLEMLAPAVIYPLLAAIILPLKRKSKIHSFDSSLTVFLWSGVIAGYILCFALKASSGARMLIPANFFILLMILSGLNSMRVNVRVCISAYLLCLLILGFEIKEDFERSQFDRKMYDEYERSEDGTIFLNNKDFANNFRRINASKQSYILEAAYRSGDKKELKVRPEWMRDHKILNDTDLVAGISDNSWIIYTPKNRESEFIVNKTLLPGIINLKLGERKLDLTPSGDVVIDSTANNIIGIYVNDRPYIHVDLEIRRLDPTD